ncbi:hypothetical protein [Deinococcus xinjiangensis]
MKGFSRLSARWQARLMALPGVLTLLSVLAVVLGGHTPAHDPQPRLTTGTMSPALPELRPTPQPAPSVPLLPAPPPQPFRIATTKQRSAPLYVGRSAPKRQLDLAWWGRQQTDGA